MITYLHFLRHGEVAGGPILRGVTDDPVTEQGLKQMANAVNESTFDVIVSSPLIRCLQFANEYAHHHSLPLIIDNGLQEINFGDWEGQPYDTLFSEINSPAEQYFARPYSHFIPNGERTSDFDARVWSAVTKQVNAHQGQRILFVTHAGVMRSILTKTFSSHLVNSKDSYLPVKISHGSRLLFECFSSDDNQLTLTLSL